VTMDDLDELWRALVLNEGQGAAGPGYVVDDTEDVAEVLEELARLRRGT
jgi:hypothetical protein